MGGRKLWKQQSVGDFQILTLWRHDHGLDGLRRPLGERTWRTREGFFFLDIFFSELGIYLVVDLQMLCYWMWPLLGCYWVLKNWCDLSVTFSKSWTCRQGKKELICTFTPLLPTTLREDKKNQLLLPHLSRPPVMVHPPAHPHPNTTARETIGVVAYSW